MAWVKAATITLVIMCGIYAVYLFVPSNQLWLAAKVFMLTTVFSFVTFIVRFFFLK